MRRKIFFFPGLALLYILLFYVLPQRALADNCSLTISPSSMEKKQFHDGDGSKDQGGMVITGSNCFRTTKTIKMYTVPEGVTKYEEGKSGHHVVDIKKIDDSTLMTTDEYINFQDGVNDVYICVPTGGGNDGCHSMRTSNTNVIGKTTVTTGKSAQPDTYSLPEINPDNQTCTYIVGSAVNLKATKLEPNTGYEWWMVDHENHHADIPVTDQTETTFEVSENTSEGGESPFLDQGKKTICVDKIDRGGEDRHETNVNCIDLLFTVTEPTGDTSCTGDPTFEAPPNPCKSDYIPRDADGNPSGGCARVDTAIGTIATTPEAFIERVFGIVLSLAGGIALLLIIYSGYELITSQGNQEKVQAARERLTAAIVGLLFIIFSLFILSVIGVDILRIPGFSS
jgi:hypothetical protein